MLIEKGDLVQCIPGKANGGLTEGKIYDVTYNDGTFIGVLNDDHREEDYFLWRFQLYMKKTPKVFNIVKFMRGELK